MDYILTNKRLSKQIGFCNATRMSSKSKLSQTKTKTPLSKIPVLKKTNATLISKKTNGTLQKSRKDCLTNNMNHVNVVDNSLLNKSETYKKILEKFQTFDISTRPVQIPKQDVKVSNRLFHMHDVRDMNFNRLQKPTAIDSKSEVSSCKTISTRANTSISSPVLEIPRNGKTFETVVGGAASDPNIAYNSKLLDLKQRVMEFNAMYDKFQLLKEAKFLGDNYYNFIGDYTRKITAGNIVRGENRSDRHDFGDTKLITSSSVANRAVKPIDPLSVVWSVVDVGDNFTYVRQEKRAVPNPNELSYHSNVPESNDNIFTVNSPVQNKHNDDDRKMQHKRISRYRRHQKSKDIYLFCIIIVFLIYVCSNLYAL